MGSELKDKKMLIETVEMHTGGEPLRIITSGYPEIIGDTILEKRRYVREHLDHLRRLLMFEPRGHFDQYGALLVKPDHPEADIAVIFMHNEGYSTMCGHAVIALGRFAIDYGYKKIPVGKFLLATWEPSSFCLFCHVKVEKMQGCFESCTDIKI